MLSGQSGAAVELADGLAPLIPSDTSQEQHAAAPDDWGVEELIVGCDERGVPDADADWQDGHGQRWPPSRSTMQAFALSTVSVLMPWMLSLMLGVLTALTGTYIALGCDFLGDLRFGFCQGIAFADRNRCCGGSENVDLVREGCIGIGDGVKWVLWTDYLGMARGPVSWVSDTASFGIYALLSAVLAGIAAFLVHEYCPAARGSGIPDVKGAVSGFDLPQSFSGSCLMVKSLGLSLAVGAGLSLGKEGPLIHIGVCWSYLLSRFVRHLRLPGAEAIPLHDLACAGAAAGVSTAFGAPLGGVLFAVEELGSVRPFGSRTLLYAFMAAISASTTLKHIDLSGANRLTLFAPATSTKEWRAWEMGAFLLVGVLCGLVGVAFVKVNLWCTEHRRRCQKVGRLWLLPTRLQACLSKFLLRPADVSSRAPGVHVSTPSERMQTGCLAKVPMNVIEGAIIAIMTAILNYPLDLTRAVSTEAIHALFEECPTIRDRFGLCEPPPSAAPQINVAICTTLFLAAFLRLIQTSYTFGAAIPSGLFIPSLYIGATLGRVTGNLAHALHEQYGSSHQVHIDSGMFAMVGAVAMLSGFCRMTVSLVIIMFELTGQLSYLVPFMCATLAAKLVGDPMSPSIYDGHAKLNGIAPIEEQTDIRLEMVVGDIASAVASRDIIDGSAPVPLRALRGLTTPTLATSREAAAADRAGGPASASLRASRSSLPEVLLVTRIGANGSDPSSEVLGILEKSKLRRWLEEVDPVVDSCDLSTRRASSSGTLPGILSQASTCDGPAAADARDIVDRRFVQLCPFAPVLTAYCAFQEKPDLRYCVCFDKKLPSRFRILSRCDFKRALTSPIYPLARLGGPSGEPPSSHRMEHAHREGRWSEPPGAAVERTFRARTGGPAD